jgi:hypothetical protein
MSSPPLCAVLSVVCCAVLCCAVLCCAVLCCAVLCCAVLWYPSALLLSPLLSSVCVSSVCVACFAAYRPLPLLGVLLSFSLADGVALNNTSPHARVESEKLPKAFKRALACVLHGDAAVAGQVRCSASLHVAHGTVPRVHCIVCRALQRASTRGKCSL